MIIPKNAGVMENKSILKKNWERRSASLILSEEEIEQAISSYSNQPIASCQLLSDGCANSNYKVIFSNSDCVVFRVYTRDPDSLMREYHIHEMIQEKVPVPRFLFINTDQSIIPYPFAVLEFVEGRLFRDVIFEENHKVIEECAYDAGKILTKIASFQFDFPGFFESDLSLIPFENNQTYFDIILEFLGDENVVKSLGRSLTQRLTAFTHEHEYVLIDISKQHSLTHADYDPSNMLVKEEEGNWKIAAILDWEFAFSSTPSVDTGLMLRYAPQLPAFYQRSFINGIKDANASLLPSDWELRAKLADMLSLLSLLASEDAEQRFEMVEDVKSLLTKMN